MKGWTDRKCTHELVGLGSSLLLFQRLFPLEFVSLPLFVSSQWQAVRFYVHSSVQEGQPFPNNSSRGSRKPRCLGNSVISTMSSEKVLVQCSAARPGRWESLQSSLEKSSCLLEDSRSPETQRRSGEKGRGACVVTRRPGRGLRRWAFGSVLGELFPFCIPCPM